MSKRKRGHPPKAPDKMTPETVNIILETIAALAPMTTAADRAGVSTRSVRWWMLRGKRESDGPYRDFFSAVKKTRADALLTRVIRIGKAGEGGAVIEKTTITSTSKSGSTTTKTIEKIAQPQWVSDAWKLERSDPGNWAINRREVKEMKERLDALLKAIDSGKLVPAVGHSSGQGSRGDRPKVGGDADPESI